MAVAAAPREPALGDCRIGLKYADLFRACSLLGAGPLQLDFLEDDPDLAPIEARRRLFEAVYGSDNDYYLAQHPRTWATARGGQLPPDHRIRIKVGAADNMLGNNRKLRDHLVSLGIAHDYLELPGVGHAALPTLLRGCQPMAILPRHSWRHRAIDRWSQIHLRPPVFAKATPGRPVRPPSLSTAFTPKESRKQHRRHETRTLLLSPAVYRAFARA